MTLASSQSGSCLRVIESRSNYFQMEKTSWMLCLRGAHVRVEPRRRGQQSGDHSTSPMSLPCSVHESSAARCPLLVKLQFACRC